IPAVPVFVSSVVAGNKLTATYTFNAPGGSWDPTDNGTYTTTLQPSQVADIDAATNFVPTGSLGDFFVKIPVTIVVDDATDVADGNTTAGHVSIREAITIANGLSVNNAAT